MFLKSDNYLRARSLYVSHTFGLLFSGERKRKEKVIDRKVVETGTRLRASGARVRVRGGCDVFGSDRVLDT